MSWRLTRSSLRFGLIDFVDGHDDGHFGGFGVVDGFLGLRHHAIVGGDDQHDDVGNFRSARTHASESFVTGRVDENDAAVIDDDFIRADVLGDSAGFATCHVGLANGVEQTGFAVVDVAHDGNDRRTRLETFLGFFLGDFENHFFFERDDADDAAESFRQGAWRSAHPAPG